MLLESFREEFAKITKSHDGIRSLHSLVHVSRVCTNEFIVLYFETHNVSNYESYK